MYRQRLEFLLEDSFVGFVLVLLVLSAFLEFRLAFWVTMGIPTSFLGAFLLLPLLGISINMMSLFAFLIALGIAVDDAIVVGENTYEYRERGLSFVDAAIAGARDVVVPVGFSILTNIVAFLPMLLVPGIMGKIWGVIPVVVGCVFVVSWLETFFVLPSHLAHVRERVRTGWTAALHERQQAFGAAFTRFIARGYQPVIDAAIRSRYLTVALAVGLLMVVLSWAMSGRMGFILMPTVEADQAVVTARLPLGSPLATTLAVRDRLVAGARAVAEAHGGDALSTGIGTLVQENVIETSMYLTDPDTRPISTTEVARLWREEVGTIGGLEFLRYEADRGGPGSGAGVTVELSHRQIEVLERASQTLAASLAEISGVGDVDDGYEPGKPQLDLGG
jgi:multidrug efflux pump subunit AcrB